MTHTVSIPAPRLPARQTPDVPERVGKALLGRIQEPDVRPLFHVASVTTPLNAEDFVKACRAQRSARPDTTSAPVPPAIEPLPPSLEAQAAALRGTEQFRTTYEPFGATFARVPLAELVTPQWWVDTEYIQTLTDAVPAEDDLDGMFGFSFATGRLAMPMHLGLNGAAFASAKIGDIGVPSPLRVARYSPERVTFEFDVTPRPNWVWLAASQDMSRLLILNGVHHLLALLEAGRTHALCLLRPAQSLGDPTIGFNFQDPSLFKPSELTAARPPLLRDYLDDQQAVDVGIHLRQNFLRLAVQSDPGVIPRVA